MTETFETKVSMSGENICVMQVSGHLDAKSVPRLVFEATGIASSGKDLVIVMSGVPFVSSTGIGALLVISERFKEMGRNIRFAEMTSPAMAALKLLNLDSYLELDLTKDRALAALAA